jgi:hypothetical protein
MLNYNAKRIYVFVVIAPASNSEQASLLVLSCGKSIFHEKHYLSGDFAVRFAATKACSRNVVGNFLERKTIQ